MTLLRADRAAAPRTLVDIVRQTAVELPGAPALDNGAEVLTSAEFLEAQARSPASSASARRWSRASRRSTRCRPAHRARSTGTRCRGRWPQPRRRALPSRSPSKAPPAGCRSCGLRSSAAAVTATSDDFFDAGGGSLSAAQLVSRLRERFPSSPSPMCMPSPPSVVSRRPSIRWTPRPRRPTTRGEAGRVEPHDLGARPRPADGDLPRDGADRPLPQPAPPRVERPRDHRAPGPADRGCGDRLRPAGRDARVLHPALRPLPLRRLHRRRHRRRPRDPARVPGVVDLRRQRRPVRPGRAAAHRPRAVAPVVRQQPQPRAVA